MVGNLSWQRLERSIKNPHFWIIALLIVLLAVFYSSWPWRPWSLILGHWPVGSISDFLNHLADIEFRYHTIGILFLFPFIYSTLAFGWRGALTCWIIIICALTPILIGLWPNFPTFFRNIAFLLIPFFIILVVIVEVESRRRERKIIAERQKQQQLYVSMMHDEAERIRKRFAQELHDDSIQALLAVNARVDGLISENHGKHNGDVGEVLSWVHDTISHTVDNMRRICLSLRPSVIDDLGLVSALRWLVDQTEKHTDIAAQLVLIGDERKLEPKVEENLFRIVQEALNNIKYHSEARNATVILESVNGYLRLTIEDNGRGFDIANINQWLSSSGKLGLTGMQQRVNSLNGIFHINSEPGTGTKISIELKC